MENDQWRPMASARRNGHTIVLLVEDFMPALPDLGVARLDYYRVALGAWHTPRVGTISVCDTPDPNNGQWVNEAGAPLRPIAWAPIPVIQMNENLKPVFPWLAETHG